MKLLEAFDDLLQRWRPVFPNNAPLRERAA